MKQSIAVTFQAPSAHTLVGSGDSDLSIGMRDKVIRYEQRLIAETLRACHYNRQLTAKRLGISLNTLWRKMPHDLNSRSRFYLAGSLETTKTEASSGVI
jgi:DNA-binding NtrC family response regulator